MFTQIDVLIEKYEKPPHEIDKLIAIEAINRKLLASVSTMHHTFMVIRKRERTWFISENISGNNPVEHVTEPLPIAQVKYLFFLFVQTVITLQRNNLSICDWQPDNFVMCDTMVKFMNYSSIRSLTNEKISNKGSIAFIGDPRWMAPEALLSEEYDISAADMWCLGLYLYLMLVGKPLFENSRSLYRDMAKFQLELPQDVNPHAAELLHSLLTKDPTKRPKIHDLLMHKFLTPIPSFPNYRSTFENTEELEKWFAFFGYNLDETFANVRASVLDGPTMMYYLCNYAIERGRLFDESVFSQCIPSCNYSIDNILMPEKLDLVDTRLDIGVSEQSTIRDMNPPNEKKQKIRKLLKACTSRLEERGEVLHLDAFVEESSGVS